ncbi:hypothetical protein B0O99DRAFT_531040 [Bisporella sp. PMI_857]|nr:hypothetical protein B0O99DRAFT_531040 [Bisporella sp. PMI_857]
MSIKGTECSYSADNVFGPVVAAECRQGFDFTLFFEQSILSILPSSLFLLAVVPRLVRLHSAQIKTASNFFRRTKLLLAALLICLHLALLVLWIRGPDSHSRVSTTIPACTIILIGAVATIPLSYLEDARAVRPSSVLSMYLLGSGVLDIAQARTLFEINCDTVGSLFVLIMGVKISLLILEARDKRSYMEEPYVSYSRETTSGIINRSFFWWLNSLFKAGYQSLLSPKDLEKLDATLLSKELGQQMQAAWEHCSTCPAIYLKPFLANFN